MTGVVHVTRTISSPDMPDHVEHAHYPWPGSTAADICRDSRFTECSRGRTKTRTNYIGEGVTIREDTTVTDEP